MLEFLTCLYDKISLRKVIFLTTIDIHSNPWYCYHCDCSRNAILWKYKLRTNFHFTILTCK